MLDFNRFDGAFAPLDCDSSAVWIRRWWWRGSGLLAAKDSVCRVSVSLLLD
jgi:hypothetical protein